jgi:multidrug efflux pump subunit AcrA (membrane-fusion protein)
MNVLEQARKLLERERAAGSPSSPPPTHTPKVTVVMRDQIFDALCDDGVPPAEPLATQQQLTEQQATERRRRDQLFMDDVRRLGELAQLEYEKQQQLNTSKPEASSVLIAPKI